MEADKVLYCAVCCDMTAHRYAHETEAKRFYSCRGCGTDNHEWKRVPTEANHQPGQGVKRVNKGDPHRVGKGR